jgi:glycosyltransferase involved in cell wall biosynthesis
MQHIPDRFKGKLKSAYQRFCSRLLIKLSERVIVFSEMTEEYLRSIDRRIPSVKVLYSVPAEFGPPLANPRWRSKVRSFGYLGVNTPRKNVSTLIRAFMRLDEPDVELHIGGFEPGVEREADPRIHWWGYVDGVEKERFYRSIDVLVLPSFSDPWGLVVNEAMHRGCLAGVSTECGSSEMVKQASPDFVFTPDEAGVYAFLADCLALSPEERHLLQLKAAELIQRYSIANTSRIWHDLLVSIGQAQSGNTGEIA